MISDYGEGAVPRQSQPLQPPPRQRRFYTEATMAEEDGVYLLRLDGRRAMTPAKRPLAVPHRRIAEAIAAEWQAQAEFLDPGTMPVTRLANSAIDGVAERLEEVREAILAYAGTDLLCYRAGDPEGLVEEQRRTWDPVLGWAEKHFGGRFVLAEGVMHVPQPEETLRSVKAELDAEEDPFRLAGLNLATTLTGSAVLVFAIRHGAIEPEDGWVAAHVDEDWNIRLWGEDAEASARRANRRRDFDAAVLAFGR